MYQPCEELGGDFYDFVETEERLVVIVSDVVGHGFEAALTTMLLKEIFKEAVRETREPVELLSRMNRRLHRALPKGMYAAASVLDFSAASGDLKFAGAGLPYPFVLRADERCVERIEAAGFPLGLLAEAAIPFEVRSIQMFPGDVLLVGSDGIHTIAGGNGELFEDARLPRLLAELVGRTGEDVIHRLAEEALRFNEGEALPDDLNLLSVTRE